MTPTFVLVIFLSVHNSLIGTPVYDKLSFYQYTSESSCLIDRDKLRQVAPGTPGVIIACIKKEK